MNRYTRKAVLAAIAVGAMSVSTMASAVSFTITYDGKSSNAPPTGAL